MAALLNRRDLPPWEGDDEIHVLPPLPLQVARPQSVVHNRRMAKFFGTIDQLKDRVLPLGLDGEWAEMPNDCWKFTLKNRAGLNWSANKGTIWLDGPNAPKVTLTAIVEKEFGDGEVMVVAEAKPAVKKKVFVVYGHDEPAKTQLEAMLRRWDLEPLILDQLASGGQTIIEKLEKARGESDFAVILATPDDEGHRKTHPEEKAFRARQNVVLELGMMLSILGRSRVAILLKSDVQMERPSDIQGLIYISFKDDVKETALTLAKELDAQGFKIDLGRL